LLPWQPTSRRSRDAHEVDLGGPYDLIVMGNLLHNFAREPGAPLVARLRGACSKLPASLATLPSRCRRRR
jgi:hypothetical protein